MLNMLDTQDKLKSFSEEQLIKEMQMPSGSAPQFMVLGEIERRKRMRSDAQRQEGLMQPTVAQEAVNGAGVPQQGIAGIAQSLAPQTSMAQNTGVGSVQEPTRMAEGGPLSAGTMSAIAQLKVAQPSIYAQVKDDPEELKRTAEFFASDAVRGLASTNTPFVPPSIGPTELNTPTVRNAAGSNRSTAGLATPLRDSEETGLASTNTPFVPPSIGPTELNTPTVRNAAGSNRSTAGLATPLRDFDPEDNKLAIEALNTAIRQAASDGNDTLVETLTTKRNALLIPVKVADTAAGVGDAITNTGSTIFNALGNVGGNVSNAYQKSLGAVIDPVEAAKKLDEYKATRAFVEAKKEPILTAQSEAAAARADEIAALSGADRMEDMSTGDPLQVPAGGISELMPPKSAEQIAKEAEKIATRTAGGGTQTGGVGSNTRSGGAGGGGGAGSGSDKKSGIAAVKNGMDQDKWLALAQAGLTLMSTGDFGKAGIAGLGALRQTKADDMAERKLDAELALRNAQTGAANRSGRGGGGGVKPPPSAYLTYLSEKLEAQQGQLANLTPMTDSFFGGRNDPDAGRRKAIKDEIGVTQQQINSMLRAVGLSTAPADSRVVVK